MTTANPAPEPSSPASEQSFLVQMPATQYQAFLNFQRMQMAQSQALNLTSVVPKGAARTAPIASTIQHSKVSARPALIADPRGDSPTAGQLVVVSSSSSSMENREEDELRPPPKKTREKKSSPPGGEGRPTLRSPHRKPPNQGLWRCPNCGSQEAGHDILTCNAPRRHDLSPSLSAAEIEYLVKLDQLRSHNRKLQRDLKQGQEEQQEKDEEGSSLGTELDSEFEEEEEESEGDQDFLDDDSASEYIPSRSTSSP
jgi:hypothetical protein